MGLIASFPFVAGCDSLRTRAATVDPELWELCVVNDRAAVPTPPLACYMRKI